MWMGCLWREICLFFDFVLFFSALIGLICLTLGRNRVLECDVYLFICLFIYIFIFIYLCLFMIFMDVSFVTNTSLKKIKIKHKFINY